MLAMIRNQLTNMATKSKDAMATTELNVVADWGYFSSQEVLKYQGAGITPTLPKTATSGAKADGRFGWDHFIYHPEQNEYSCPAG
jgi:transposase